MSVQITILYDNRCDNCQLQEGWGFSALIEHAGNKILFDTGGDVPSFTSNVEKLNISYSEITHLMFSHRHWDHMAGLNDVVNKLNKDAALYVPQKFPWLPLRRAGSRLNKIVTVRSFAEVAPNVYSLVMKCGFRLYEQILVLKTAQGLGIITGCAHPGIVEIVKVAQERLQDKVYFVTGGFHQLFTPPQKSAAIVSQFQKLNVFKVAPCHCSGDHLIRQFKEAYGDNYYKVGTGTVLTF